MSLLRYNMPSLKPVLMRFSTLMLPGLLLLLPGVVSANGDAEAGAKIAQFGGPSGVPCMSCHGMAGEGNAAAGFPRLDMLSADYLYKQLRDYKAGTRSNPLMLASLDNISAQQLLDVATYYSNQRITVMPPSGVDPALLTQGEVLATRGDWSRTIVPCNTCHGPEGNGVGAVFPAISGQYGMYIQKQLLDWKNGIRNNDPGELMAVIAKRLTEADITAIAAYLESLPSMPRTGLTQ